LPADLPGSPPVPRLNALLGGLRALLEVLLADLRRDAQRLLVARQRRVEKLRVNVGLLLGERLERLPLALALLLQGFGTLAGALGQVVHLLHPIL
jgi:hypothetical protein